jgi:hypothetical protein
MAAVAVVLRIPALLATRHLSFDDGVYGASAVAMRAGGLPYRDVFSSQGPLFLPLVWLFDLLGLRTLDAPRLLAVASGAALVLATWSAARAVRLSTGAAALAAGLVAVSGSVLWVTGPLTSDGPGLALAAWAVTAALWYRRSPSLRRAVAAGVLLGAALSVKSLLLAAGLPVAWVLLGNRRHLAAAVATAGAVSLAVALPWGLDNVWDQAFDYHLEAAGSRTPVPNLRKVLSTLGDRDLPLLLAALAAMATAVAGRRSRTRKSTQPANLGGDPVGVRLVAVWLAATVIVLAAEHPLWRNHVSHLVPATALLVAVAFDRARIVPRPAVLVAGGPADSRRSRRHVDPADRLRPADRPLAGPGGDGQAGLRRPRVVAPLRRPDPPAEAPGGPGLPTDRPLRRPQGPLRPGRLLTLNRFGVRSRDAAFSRGPGRSDAHRRAAADPERPRSGGGGVHDQRHDPVHAVGGQPRPGPVGHQPGGDPVSGDVQCGEFPPHRIRRR